VHHRGATRSAALSNRFVDLPRHKLLSMKGRTIMRFSNLPALVALSLLATPAAASPDAQFRDLTVQQATTTPARTPCLCLPKVSLAADRADWTYAVGETVGLRLTSNEDAYVTVLDIGPTGRVTQLFPNPYQPDNHVFANSPVEIGGNSGARVMVTGSVGVELIKVIASRRPVTVFSESELQGRGAFRTVDGGVETALRDLQLVADQAVQSGTRIMMTNFSLHTIASQVAGAQALIVVPGQQVAPYGALMEQP
jgi:hypothetical protein